MSEQKNTELPKSDYSGVPQDESNQDKQESCCNITCQRRTFRIAVLFTIILICIIVPVVYIAYMHVLEYHHLSTSKPLKFLLKNCKLYITEDSERPIDDIYLSANVPGIFIIILKSLGSDFKKNLGDTTEIIVKSNIGYTDACSVDLQINPKASLKNLEIECQGSCVISQMGPNPLNITGGILAVVGDTIDFLATNLIATQILGNIKKGNIHIYSLSLTSNSGYNSLVTEQGDIVVQSLNSMRITWIQNKDRVCMYAPQIFPTGTIKSTCYASLNEASTPSSCNTDYVLCKAGESCTATTQAPTLILSANVGNVYANVLNANGEPVSNSVNSVRGWEYTKGLDFDESLNRTLGDYINGFNGSSKADPAIWVSLGPSRAFSSASLAFLLVANTAYLDAYPWWISFFSASLLLGRVNYIDGNLAPGLCPFKTLPTAFDLFNVRSLLLTRLTLFSGRAEAAYLYGPSYQKITSFPQISTGFRGTEGKTRLYGIAFDGTNYNLKEYKLDKAISLLLAVIISIILAFIMGLLIFFILVIALGSLVTHIILGHAHLNNYTARVQGGKSAPVNIPVDNVADPNMEEEDEDKKHSIMELSPFMLIDHVVEELKKTLTSSVDEFCESLFVQLKPDDVDDYQPIRERVIRVEYEKYCFLKQMPEEDLMSDENKKLFIAKGFTFEKPAPDKKGQEVEMLIKVRWAHEDEIIGGKEVDEQSSDASLQKFFKQKCVKTPFDADKIEFVEFSEKYNEFCDAQRMAPSVITRAHLHDAFGVESITETPEYLVRSGDTARYKVDLDHIRQMNEELMALYSNKPRHHGKELSSVEQDSLAKAKSLRAFLYDVIAVLLHIVFLAILAIFLVIMPMFVELEYSRYMISEDRYNFKYEDFMYSPWNIPQKVKYLHVITLICFAIAGLYVLMGLIELIVYYRYMSFPRQSLKDTMKIQKTIFSKIVRGIEWAYICIVLSLMIMYISLVIVWSILGAILNPNAYLAYGMAAATLVSFIVAKVTEFKKLNFMGIQALQDMLFSKLQGFLTDIMKKILTQAGFSSGAVSDALDPSKGNILERTERLVRGSAVGKAMVSMGIDPGDAIGVLSGDENALIEIGVKQGVPKDVMKLLLAMIKGRKRDIILGIRNFASIPQLQLDPEIIQIAIDIITNNSELNIPVLVTNLSQLFFDIAFKQFVSTMDPKEDKDKIAYLEICKQVFPRLISAFRYFKAEDIDLFIEQFEGINDYLYDSVKKKYVALASSKVKVFGNLFDDRGEPKFALPSYLMKAVNIFKLVTISEEGKLKGPSMRNVKNAMFYIMKDFFAADDKIINIVNALLSSSPETLLGTDSRKGIISLDEQEKIVTDMAAVMNIPATPLRFAWKFYTGNYVVTEQFIDEVTNFVVDVMGLGGGAKDFAKKIKPWTLMILQLFSIASTRLSDKSLKKDASKFGVDQTLAAISHLFGEYSLNEKTYNELANNVILKAIATELHIPINHTLGVIALFKGDYNNELVYELIDSLKKRWGLNDIPTKLIVSVLAIVLSKNETAIIDALEILGLWPVEFVLTAKKLLHPANISDTAFEKLGIRMDDVNVANRAYIPTDSLEVWDDWLKSMRKLLSAEFRPVKAKAKKRYQGPPKPVAPPVGVSVDIKPNPDAKVENKQGDDGPIDEENKEEKKEENKEEKKEEKKEEPNRQEALPQETEQNEGDDKRGAPFTKTEKILRNGAKVLLSLADMNINEPLIKGLFGILTTTGAITDKQSDKVCSVLIILIRAIKDLKEKAPDNKIKAAINQIAELFSIPPQPLNAILAIIYLRNPEDVLDGVEFLLRKVLSKYEVDEIRTYASFCLNQQKVMKNVERSVYSIAEKLKIPKFLVKFVLSPICEEEQGQKFGIDEFMLLMDQAGFNDTAMKEKGIAFTWPNQEPVSFDELRFMLAGLVVGNSSMLRQLLKKLGMPQSIMNLAFSMTSEDPMVCMSAICEVLAPAMQKIGIPKNALYTILEIGSGSKPAIDRNANCNGYEFLKKKLGVVPEVLICLEAVIKQDYVKLVDEIPNMIKALCDLDRIPDEMRVKPEIVSGLMTILTGNNKSLEKLAEAMKVDQGLIDLCLRLTNITRFGEDKIDKQLVEFLQSPLLGRVWEKLQIQSDVMDSLLTLTFRTYDLENPNRLLQKLGVFQHVDMSFVKFLLSIAKSYGQLQSPSNPPQYKDTEKRISAIEDLKKYMSPICKRLCIDPTLALIGIRLRQGDFYIIEDYMSYLHILLPTPNARKLAMGVTGFMTLPIQFNREFGKYPATFNHATTFEGANEMLCELLKINPIVPRMMMLDDDTLKLIENKFGMSRKVIAWLVGTLSNLPIFVLGALAIRGFKKQVHLKKLELEKMLSLITEEEAKLNELNKDSNKQSINMEQAQQPEAKMPFEVNKEEAPGENAEPAEGRESVVRPGTGETKQILLSIKKKLMEMKANAEKDDYYEKINFDTEEYANLDSVQWKQESASHLNEIFEVLLFNNENHCPMDYDYITGKDRRTGAFEVTDEKIQELFGTKMEYYKELSKVFYKKPEDPKNWLNDETLNLSYNWIYKEEREIRNNSWEVIKKLLEKISSDTEITNNTNGKKYDNIRLDQLCLFIIMMKIRTRMDMSADIKRKDKYYSLFAAECMIMNIFLESITLTKGLLGPKYSRIRFMKVISMALNMNFANTADQQIAPSFYSENLFHWFKPDYVNPKDIRDALDYCNSFPQTVQKIGELMQMNYNGFRSYASFLEQPNDVMDALNIISQASPYAYQAVAANSARKESGDEDEGGDNELKFTYEFPKDDIFVEYITKEEITKRLSVFVKPREMTHEKFEKGKEDPKSRRTADEAEAFMQQIETAMVVEQEKYDLVLDLAMLKWNVFDKLQAVVKKAEYIKDENTFAAYKALMGVATMRKNIQEWRLDYVERKAAFETNVMDLLMPYMGKINNENLVQHIILLAHGVITPETIKDLAEIYGLDSDLVNVFFMSSYPTEVLFDKESLIKLVTPLLTKLRLHKPGQKELIFALLDIYHCRPEGWQKLAEYCCFKQKKNAALIFKIILNLFDWDVIEDQRDPDIDELDDDSNLVPELPEQVTQILKFVIENETGKQVPFDEKKVVAYMRIANGINNKDIKEIIENFREIKEDFGLQDDNYIDLLESFIFFTNKLVVSDPYEREELIKSSVDTMVKWLSSLMIAKAENVAAENIGDFNKNKDMYIKTVKKILTFIVAAIHGDFHMAKIGLAKSIPLIDKVSRVFQYLKRVKAKIFTANISIRKLSPQTLESTLKCFFTLLSMAFAICEFAERNKKEIYKKDQPRSVSTSLLDFKGHAGRTFEYIMKFNNQVEEIFEQFGDFLKNADVTLKEIDENEEESQAAIKAVLDKMKDVNGWSEFEPIVLLLVGDPYLMLDSLRNHTKTIPKEALDIFEVILDLINMNERQFKMTASKQEKLDAYTEKIAKGFITPINNYIDKQLKARFESKTNEIVEGSFEHMMLKKASEAVSDPKLLTHVVILMHHIMFGTVRKRLITPNINAIFKTLLGTLSNELKDLVPPLMYALTGYQEKGSVTDEEIPMEERRMGLLRIFIRMAIPDLEPKIDLIDRLVSFSLHFAKTGINNTQIREEMPKLAEELGALVGISSELIRGVFGIMNGDIDALIKFVAPLCKIDENVINTLQTVLSAGNKLMDTVKTENNASKDKTIDDVERSSWMELMKKVNDGSAGLRELFELADKQGDKSGGISQEEFSQLMMKLNMPMTTHRVNEIFSRCKSKHSSKGPDELDVQEFEEAVKYVQSKRILEGLHLIGISTNQLIFLFTVLVIILILLFVFIFLGITAFSMGGTFGSIINSMLPLGAGFAVGQKSPIDFKDEEWSKKLKDVADEVIHMIGS